MSESVIKLASRLEVLKRMICHVDGRLTIGESMVYRQVIQDQIEALRSVVGIYLTTSFDVVRDKADEDLCDRWREEWNKLV
jgi:hypothetical protein